MPKQIWKIEQFHGGLNNNADPRDINDSEFSSAADIMVDGIGKVRTMGGTEAAHSNHGGLFPTPGKGLAAFSHDPILARGGRIIDLEDNYPGVLDNRYGVGTYEITSDSMETESAGVGLTVEILIEDISCVDADENVYTTVTIGEQEWMAGNLGTTSYNDATAITKPATEAEWDALDNSPPGDPAADAGGYAVYEDNQDYYDTRGYLYNWHAVNTGILAPSGWHVPTDDEWKELEMALGMSQEEADGGTVGDGEEFYRGTNEGSKMAYENTADLSLWLESDLHDDELQDDVEIGSSGLNLVPGGYRGPNVGHAEWLGIVTQLRAWTSSKGENEAGHPSLNNAIFRKLDNSYIQVGRGQTDMNNGFTVRCVRDVRPGDELIITITNFGTGYSEDDVITIPGGLLSSDPDDPAPNIIFTVREVVDLVESVPATNYLALTSTLPAANGDPSKGEVYLYEDVTTQWDDLYSPTLDLGELVNGETFEPVMYFVDGSLKICDGNFVNNSVSKVYETVYLNAAGGLLVNDKFSFDQKLIKPILGSGGNAVNFSAEPPVDSGQINISISEGSAGTWNTDEKKYTLFTTYSYRDNQESNTTILRSDAFAEGTDISQKVSVKIYSESNLISKRIRAVNFYYSLNSDEKLSLYFLASADLEKGLQQHNGITKAWSEEDTYIQAEFDIESPSVTTFEARNGFSPNEAISARYKTALIANRRVYVGNIYQNFQSFGDRMLKSPVNKFDTFPESNFIDASVQDGDEIVKLEEYADRLLQFKKNKMHLINISQNIEFLEDTFMHKGVSHPAATCKTDFGIAWVNKYGVYLYDGKSVTNLLEKKGMQIIKESEWTNFLSKNKDGTGGGLTPMISYIPNKRQLIVFDDITGTSIADPRMYLYDIVTQSWSTGFHSNAYRYLDAPKTNVITDWDGDLIYAHTDGEIKKWNDTSLPTYTLDLRTRDIDFKEPAQKKRVYKVIVTYKSNGSSNVDVDFAVNGGNSWTEISDGLVTTSNAWLAVELDVTPADIYSFMLRFQTSPDLLTPDSFEINDISIIYRLKGGR